MGHATIIHGDCVAELDSLPPESVDAIVTDPPYGLGFMGKKWDDLPPGLAFAEAALRVLKPGGHLLAFGGTRTWHRLAVAVEDAGFEIRDSIAWLYGSGFPKSMDVSKAIDKATGAVREVVEYRNRPSRSAHIGNSGDAGLSRDEWRDSRSGAHAIPVTAPATPEAERWQGWGTALKPAFEPVVVARKPLTGTVAANVQEHGTGAINVDGCRIDSRGEAVAAHKGTGNPRVAMGQGWHDVYKPGDAGQLVNTSGRWPANVALDESQAATLDQQSGTSTSRRSTGKNGTDTAKSTWGLNRSEDSERGHDDSGGASRFFYVAKAPKKERPVVDGVAHPTVKPLALMRWLVRLVTPPGGVVLDPFAGSGTTVEAALLEGFDVIGIEREADYLPLIRARVDRVR